MAAENQGHPQGQPGQGQHNPGQGQGPQGQGHSQQGQGHPQQGQGHGGPLGQHMPPHGQPGHPGAGQGQQQGQPQGQGRPNSGQAQGARDTLRDVGRQVQDGAEQLRHRFEDGLSSARSGLSDRYRDAEGLVARNPSPSLLVSFGIGFGLGVVIASLLSREEESTTSGWLDRHTPDSLRHLSHSFRDLPETFENLADAVRKLPDEIVRRVPNSMHMR